MTFRDHFSRAAAGYAAWRPHYPPALFGELAGRVPRRELAWDVGTGSGQAAVGLAGHFRRVVATDASVAQIAAAPALERVEFRVAPAETSGLPDRSVDLVTVAQALHWFDVAPFYREAARVLVPGGVLAVWCYGLLEIDAAIDPLVRAFYTDTLGPYWPPERALVDSGYRTLAFPFAEFVVSPHVIEQAMTLDALAGYLGTWSAVLRYTEACGADPVAPFVRSLAERWGPADRARLVRWPLHVRAGHHHPPGA